MASVRPQIKRLLGDSAVYGLSDASSKMVTMLATPFLTRLLTPADFGTLDLLAMLVAFATPFVVLGFDFSLQSFYFDRALFPNDQDRIRLVSSGFWAILAWGTVFSLLGFWLATKVSAVVFAGRLGPGFVKLGLLSTMASILFWFGRYILRFQFRPKNVAVLSFVNVGLNMLIGLAVVGLWHKGVWAFYTVNVVVTLMCGIAGLYLIRDQIGLTFDLSAVRKGIEVGLPFMPTNLIYLTLTLVDRFILNRFIPLSELGFYAIALKIASVMHIGINVLSVAWLPLAMKAFYDEADPYAELYRRVAIYVLAGFGLAAIGITAFAREILWILAPRIYERAIVAVGPLCLSVIALAGSYVTTLGPILKRRPGFTLALTGFCAVLNVALCYTLIPRWGIAGAAWSIAIAQWALTGLGLWVSERLMRPFRFDHLPLVVLSAAVIIGVLVCQYLNCLSLYLEIGLKLFVIGAYIAGLFLLKIVRVDQVHELIFTARKIFGMADGHV